MSILTEFFKWEEAWELIVEIQGDCLEDFEPELNNITLEQATKMITERQYPLIIDDCYLDGGDLIFNLGEEYPNYGETNVCEDYVLFTVVVGSDGIIKEIALDV